MMGSGRACTIDGGGGGGAELLPRDEGTGSLLSGIVIGGSDPGAISSGGEGARRTEAGALDTGGASGSRLAFTSMCGASGLGGAAGGAAAGRASRGRRGMPELPESICHST
jgi:hypothetical protein